MEDFKEIYKDEIDEMIEDVRKTKRFCGDYLLEELDRTKQYQKQLKYKLMHIEKAVEVINLKVPKKFKKVEEIITDKKDLYKFYYNLFFYDFIYYDDLAGFLLKDNTNFYLRIRVYTDKYGLSTDFTEELYITEEKAEEILTYDGIIDEEIKKSEEETEKAREIFISQFKEYSE